MTLGAADKGAGRAERGLRTEEILPPFNSYLARVWQAEINNKIIHTERCFSALMCVCVPVHVSVAMCVCLVVLT